MLLLSGTHVKWSQRTAAAKRRLDLGGLMLLAVPSDLAPAPLWFAPLDGSWMVPLPPT